jgi:hypothetical protein
MFAGYHVKYSKAWRAKQHAIALLWDDWKESYANSKGLESHEPLQSWGEMVPLHDRVAFS